MKSIEKTIVCLGACIFTSLSIAATDSFSRANCFNNESISYDYFDPARWRFVSSFHYKAGALKHYVTENPPAACTYSPGPVRTVNSLICNYYLAYNTRQAAVHGAFFSSEPNPDGALVPYVSDWSVVGYHGEVYPYVGYIRFSTSASDCNNRLNQWY